MPHETTQRDSAVMDDAYDEHHYDPSSEATVSAITGTNEVSDQSKEVGQIAFNRRNAQLAVQELAAVLNVAGKTVSRVSQAASQVVMRTIQCPANVAVKLVGENFDRSCLRITPIGTVTVVSGLGAIGIDPNINTQSFNPTVGSYPFNAAVFRIAAFDVANVSTPAIELRTVTDVWMMATIACVVGVIEEFVS
jgi:DNA-binding transcriptional regulator YiaG